MSVASPSAEDLQLPGSQGFQPEPQSASALLVEAGASFPMTCFQDGQWLHSPSYLTLLPALLCRGHHEAHGRGGWDRGCTPLQTNIVTASVDAINFHDKIRKGNQNSADREGLGSLGLCTVCFRFHPLLPVGPGLCPFCQRK